MDFSKLNDTDRANAGLLLDAVLGAWRGLNSDACGKILDAAERQAYDRGESGDAVRMALNIFISNDADTRPALTRSKEAEVARAKMEKAKRDVARHQAELGQLSNRR